MDKAQIIFMVNPRQQPRRPVKCVTIPVPGRLKAPWQAWQMSYIRFEPEQGEIHFDLACETKRLDCPACTHASQPIHDRAQKTWQHLHFFQYRAFLHAAVPRVKCGHCGKVTQVDVLWVRSGRVFTLLMDALMLTLAKLVQQFHKEVKYE